MLLNMQRMASAPEFVIVEMHAGEQLFRADEKYGTVGTTANALYTASRPTYFTLTQGNTNSYAKRKADSTVKVFEVKGGETLNLIDMNEPASYHALLQAQPQFADSIRVAFRLAGARVWRISEEHTKWRDDEALAAICALEGADGYYTRAQKASNNENADGSPAWFHAEVGLCPRAFRKLMLVRSIRVAADPKRQRAQRFAAAAAPNEPIPNAFKSIGRPLVFGSNANSVAAPPAPVRITGRALMFNMNSNNNNNTPAEKRKRNENTNRTRRVRARSNNNNNNKTRRNNNKTINNRNNNNTRNNRNNNNNNIHNSN